MIAPELAPEPAIRMIRAYPMKLRVDRISEEARELVLSQPAADVNPRLDKGAHDFRLVSPLEVQLTYYRAGEDLVFRGRLQTRLEGTCARCLEAFPLDLELPFELVLEPAAHRAESSEADAEDLAIGTYDGDDVDLGPTVEEHVILSLPTRALCREDCMGLCASCGRNRNAEACTCTGSAPDPRLAVLRSLKVGRA